MTGVINNRKAEVRTVDDKEDYERSIKYYLKDNTKDLKYEYQELYAVYKWYKIDRPKRTIKKDIGMSIMYYEQDSKMLSRAVVIRKFSNKLFKGGDYDPIEFNHATQKSVQKGNRS